MSQQRPAQVAPTAAWYADPSDGSQWRWWNGAEWTEHVAPVAHVAPVGPVAPVAPVAEHPTPATVAGPAAAPLIGVPAAAGSERRWGTVWVWVLAFTPWLTTLTAFSALNAASPFDTNPWDSILLVTVPIVLIVFVAFLDVRVLRQWHGKAAHWTWALLGAPIYIIARTVVLRRRGRFGTAPLWVALGNMLASLVPFIPLVGMYFVILLMYFHSLSSGS